METDDLELWKFSCEETQKRAEEISRLFLAYDGVDKAADPIVEEVLRQATEKAAKPEPVVEEDDNFNFDDLPCNAWVNIDDLNINDSSADEEDDPTESRNLKMEVVQEDVDIPCKTKQEKEENPVTEPTVNLMEDDELKIIASKIKESKQNSLPQETLEKLDALSESQIINLLKLLFTSSEDGILLFCITVSEKMESRRQNLVASLLCSHVLLNKAKESKLLGGEIYNATSHLVKTVPHIMASRFLLPMLLSGKDCQTQAIRLIESCDTAGLRHTVFRSWLDEKSPQFTDTDFELLKMFLKTPIKDSDTVLKICELYKKISAMYANNVNFAKFLLVFLKSHKGVIPKEAKEHLTDVIAANKTSFAKLLEKELAKI